MLANADQISELYKGEIWGSETQRIARDRVHWLVSHAGQPTLDIGCSQGIASILAGKAGFDVIGVDIEADSLEYARADLDAMAGLLTGSVSFQEAHAMDLPFDDETFEAILLGEVVEHLINPAGVLAEARRVLVPGGRIAITTPYGYHPHHDHVRTYYVASVLEMVGASFAIRSADVVDGYFRIVAVKADPTDQGDEFILRLQPQVEAITLGVERSLSRVRGEHQNAVERLSAEADATVELERRHEAELGVERDAVVELERRHEAELGVERDAVVELERRHEAELGVERDAVVELERRHEIELAAERSKSTKLRTDFDRARVQSARRIAKLEADRDRLRYTIDVERWKVESMRRRKWWRIGQACKLALRRPWRLIVLPFDLISLLFAPSEAIPRPIPPKSPKAPASAFAKSPETGSGSADRSQASLSIPAEKGTITDRRRSLTVATVLDTFSEMNFSYEFHTVPLHPDQWRAQIDSSRPDFLLVESAWNGYEDRWIGIVANKSGPKKPLVALVEYCKAQGIPTVFWNKEDPPNYDWFIGSARLFDHVLTVDEDSVFRYEKDLGHDRIGVLMFSAQPAIHNPTQVSGYRGGTVAFAGAYYSQKHPERKEQIDLVVRPALGYDLTIYARHLGLDKHEWPEEYVPAIVGSLEYPQVLTAHKMFKVFLNVNSVVGSNTMVPRRVFELLASGTAVISGPNPAIDAVLGRDLCAISESEEMTDDYLAFLLYDDEARHRMAVAGLREIMARHTTSDRVDEMLSQIGLSSPAGEMKTVSMITPTIRRGSEESIAANVNRQEYPHLELIVVTESGCIDKPLLESLVERADVRVLELDEGTTLGAATNAGMLAARGAYVAKMDDDNYYGPHFLTDSVAAFSYTDADIVGKWTYGIYFEGERRLAIRQPGNEYRYVDLVLGCSMVAKREVFDLVHYPDWRTGEDTKLLVDAREAGMRIYSIDRYNFAYTRGRPEDHAWAVSELKMRRKTNTIASGVSPSLIDG